MKKCIVSSCTLLYTSAMNDEQNINIDSSPAMQDNQKKPDTFKSIVKEIIIFALIAFGIVLPFRMFIAEPYIVSGASMSPTFETGHYLIVDKISYKLGNPQRNSVVVFSFPDNTSFAGQKGKNLIKRIIGLPGDTITENSNVVTITNAENPKGFVLDQSYIAHPLPSSFKITLKEGEYFVMGDNRAESFDSRSWGLLPRKDIIGRPVIRLWPLSKIGILPGADIPKAKTQ